MPIEINGTPLHESVTPERVCALAEESMSGNSYPGICIRCGEDADGVEPDARGYKCGACSHMTVYGAEEVLIYVA